MHFSGLDISILPTMRFSTWNLQCNEGFFLYDKETWKIPLCCLLLRRSLGICQCPFFLQFEKKIIGCSSVTKRKLVLLHYLFRYRVQFSPKHIIIVMSLSFFISIKSYMSFEILILYHIPLKIITYRRDDGWVDNVMAPRLIRRGFVPCPVP